ncbi:hypothetical protein ATN88_08035 [Enterovibrio coralii]|uniref:Carbamoyltransferase Kae1-like domain-containing protein n=1 Tax=Enterovibrio coralii TaxID=294935 RepID=A0A135I583_9GAMM|nr:hypothetical protein [Enterovibrio coralii]KXF80603.1 hypothetical protein ATN88_08035 [Enterovibrio coralii]
MNHGHVENKQKDALYAQLNLDGNALKTLKAMIESGLNSPMSSSAGRLFDAVSAALSVCIHQQSYEGQAAIELEALANRDVTDEELTGYPFAIRSGSPTQLDPTPMWSALLEDLSAGMPATVIAKKFHFGLAEAIKEMVIHLRNTFDISPNVVLSGGVFQNKMLLEQTVLTLKQQGIEVLIHRQIPANDGGLAFGQALIAAAVSLSGNTEKQSLGHNQ